MRRITLWMLSTVSALILLFSYRTSTMGTSGGTSGGTGGAAGTPDKVKDTTIEALVNAMDTKKHATVVTFGPPSW